MQNSQFVRHLFTNCSSGIKKSLYPCTMKKEITYLWTITEIVMLYSLYIITSLLVSLRSVVHLVKINTLTDKCKKLMQNFKKTCL